MLGRQAAGRGKGRGFKGHVRSAGNKGSSPGKKRRSGPTLPDSLLGELGLGATPGPSKKRPAADEQALSKRRKATGTLPTQGLAKPAGNGATNAKGSDLSGTKRKAAGEAVDPRTQRLFEDIQHDLHFQAALAKKLKLKKGKKLRFDDGLDDLLPPELEDLSQTILPRFARDAAADKDRHEVGGDHDEDDDGADGGDESDDGSEDDEVGGDGDEDEDVDDEGLAGGSEDEEHQDMRHEPPAKSLSRSKQPRRTASTPPGVDADSDTDTSNSGGMSDLERSDLNSSSNDEAEGWESDGGTGSEAEGLRLPASSEDSDEGQDDESDDEVDAARTARAEQGRVAGSKDRAAERGGLASTSGRYVPPALRKAAAAGASEGANGGAAGDESAEHAAVKRKVRSLVNRVALANVQRIASDVSDLLHQAPRHVVTAAIIDTILQAVEEGPRAADQYASVAASLVAAVAAQARAHDLPAKFLLAVAEALERARANGDSIACSNLARLVCYLHMCKLIGSGVVYSLLEVLKDSFTEGDVSLMLTILNVVGLALRSEDAVGMKDFVLSVHAKAAELGKEGALTQRARLMLDMVVDIKNNKRAHSDDARGGRAGALPPDLAKFVRSCGVEEVALHNLTWTKLLTCEKKGMWWLPQADERHNAVSTAAVVGSRSEEAKLLKLAASQRMNTDTRRAVFCVLMAADDYMDAFERLMRLPLKGEAERDIVRVVLDCCLQETTWNPYYAHVAMKVASASKAHKMTLQYSLWDRIKALHELNVRQLTNLAHFLALVLAVEALPLSMLKVVDFAEMSAKSTLFWRICLQHMLQLVSCEQTLQEIFLRVTSHASLRTLKGGLKLFICTKLGPWLSAKSASELKCTQDDYEALLLRVRMAESALLKAPTDVVV